MIPILHDRALPTSRVIEPYPHDRTGVQPVRAVEQVMAVGRTVVVPLDQADVSVGSVRWSHAGQSSAAGGTGQVRG